MLLEGSFIEFNRRQLNENKRQHFRANINIEGTYLLNGNKSRCIILDLSITGIGIKVNQFLTDGDILDVYFNIPEYGDVYAKVCVVFMKGTTIGANYVNIGDKSRNLIHSYIEKYASTNLRKFFK